MNQVSEIIFTTLAFVVLTPELASVYGVSLSITSAYIINTLSDANEWFLLAVLQRAQLLYSSLVAHLSAHC